MKLGPFLLPISSLSFFAVSLSLQLVWYVTISLISNKMKSNLRLQWWALQAPAGSASRSKLAVFQGHFELHSLRRLFVTKHFNRKPQCAFLSACTCTFCDGESSLSIRSCIYSSHSSCYDGWPTLHPFALRDLFQCVRQRGGEEEEWQPVRLGK